MDFFEKVGSAISVKGKEAGAKAKELAEVAKLKSNIVTYEDVIKKNYLELGRLFYEQTKDNPDPIYEKQFQNISEAMIAIEELKQQIDFIKGV